MGITSIALLPPRCLELVWCWLPWSSVLLRQVMDMEDLDKPISFREVSQEQCLVFTSKSTCSQCTLLHMFLFTEQHASPVQYVTVAPNSGHHHAPAPAVHAPALGGHRYAAAHAVSHGHIVAPVVSHDNTAAHVRHGHNVAPAISHGYSPVYQLVRPAPIRFTPSNEHGSLPSHGHITYF